MQILEDKSSSEHLRKEREYEKEIFGNTSRESFPVTQDYIKSICEEIRELYPEKQIVIMDIGCSYGYNLIGLAYKLKPHFRNVRIIGVDRSSHRIKKAKLRHLLPRIYLKLSGVNTGFYHKELAEGNYIKEYDGTEIKADIMKITDISKYGGEIFSLDDWAGHNLEKGGYLFYANSDIYALTPTTNCVKMYKKEDKLELIKEYVDKDFNISAPRE